MNAGALKLIMKKKTWLMTLLSAALAHAFATAQIHSELWGKNGEKWTPQSRLPDFSYVGYHFGEDPIPVVEAASNVRDFGAVGDGEHDDTSAFIRAIAETEAGAIEIPPGRYLISDIIWIEKPDIVLRGSGPDQTVLVISKTLEDVRPNMGKTTSGRPTSNYSWSGGFIWVKGSYGSGVRTRITSETRRGDRSLTVDKTDDIRVGDRIWIEIQDDTGKTLLNYLYSGDPGDTDKVTKPVRTGFISRVAAIEGKAITLERPIRFDLRQSWSPTLRPFAPTVSEVGIENLAFEFPNQPYEGHFTELGHNAIAFGTVSDCWVRNVRISNCDSGIFVAGVFCTLDEIVIDSRRSEFEGTSGHHGVSLGRDCLLENFDFRTHLIHDITVSYLDMGNVIKNGRGTNLSFDHHKKAPYENLFCNLDVGLGTDMWRCGGGASLGKHCAARGTFWCIRSDMDQTWPRANFGPDSMNLVGVQTGESTQIDPDGRWFEAIPPEELQPADLHAAQLERRLGR